VKKKWQKRKQQVKRRKRDNKFISKKALVFFSYISILQEFTH